MAAAALSDVNGTLLETNCGHTLARAEAPAPFGHTPAIAVLSGRA